MTTNITSMRKTIKAWFALTAVWEDDAAEGYAEELMDYLIEHVPYIAAKAFWGRIEGRDKLARKDARLARARERAMLARRAERAHKRDVPICGFSGDLCVAGCLRMPNGYPDCKIRRDTTK